MKSSIYFSKTETISFPWVLHFDDQRLIHGTKSVDLITNSKSSAIFEDSLQSRRQKGNDRLSGCMVLSISRNLVKSHSTPQKKLRLRFFSTEMKLGSERSFRGHACKLEKEKILALYEFLYRYLKTGPFLTLRYSPGLHNALFL